MHLYFIHCGFYDDEFFNGIYEFHVNLPVVANSLAEAKVKIRENKSFQSKKMHIDGVQEISIVDGYQIELSSLKNTNATRITNHLYRDF